MNESDKFGISFPEDNFIISVDNSFHLNYLVNANKDINDKIILNKSNSDVIELDSNGNIKALNKENASITISYKNEVYDTLNIYVVDESVQTSFVILPESIVIDDNYELYVGDEKEIKYSVLPQEASSYHKIISNNNNSAVTASTCNSNDPDDTAFASCFKRLHGLVLSSSSISIKAGSSGSVTVKLPSECGTNIGYTRMSADGENGWRYYVSQSRSNETSKG